MPKRHNLGGDYARDTHYEGLGDDYARDGGWSGAGRADDVARDVHSGPGSAPKRRKSQTPPRKRDRV